MIPDVEFLVLMLAEWETPPKEGERLKGKAVFILTVFKQEGFT